MANHMDFTQAALEKRLEAAEASAARMREALAEYGPRIGEIGYARIKHLLASTDAGSALLAELKALLVRAQAAMIATRQFSHTPGPHRCGLCDLLEPTIADIEAALGAGENDAASGAGKGLVRSERGPEVSPPTSETQAQAATPAPDLQREEVMTNATQEQSSRDARVGNAAPGAAHPVEHAADPPRWMSVSWSDLQRLAEIAVLEARDDAARHVATGVMCSYPYVAEAAVERWRNTRKEGA